MPGPPRSALAVVLVAALLVAGCGAGHHASARTTTATAKASGGGLAIPTPAPTRAPADPAAVAVIKQWSSALRRGDVGGAARFFALPSAMVNGAGAGGGVSVLAIRTAAQARAANESLPCGAVFISADQRGRYINALFRLTGRSGPGGSSCAGGAGQTARTNFLIERGLIVEWIRAPDDPNDNGGQRLPAPQPQPSPAGVVPVA